MKDENDTEHEDEWEMTNDEDGDCLLASSDAFKGKSWRGVLVKRSGSCPTAQASTIAATLVGERPTAAERGVSLDQFVAAMKAQVISDLGCFRPQ